jgi:hypothetical protein
MTILKSHPVTSKIGNVLEINSSKPDVNRSSPFRLPYLNFFMHKVIPYMKTRLSVYVPMDFTIVKNVTQQEVTLISNNNTMISFKNLIVNINYILINELHNGNH